MHFKSFIALVTASSMLVACAQPGGRGIMEGGSGMNKADVGTLAGAVGGGIIGSNIGKGSGAVVGTIAGTLLGGALGRGIGASLDNADRAAYNDASQRALETAQPGQSLPWSNPRSGNSGSITPKGYYRNSAGDYCREYTQSIRVGGRTEQGYGTACRQPDGTWQIVE